MDFLPEFVIPAVDWWEAAAVVVLCVLVCVGLVLVMSGVLDTGDGEG